MSTGTESPPAREPTALTRTRAVVLGLLTLDAFLLLVTGIILYFTYRPSASAGAALALGEPYRSSVDLAQATTAVHRLAAWIAVPLAITAGALLLIERRPRIDHLTATTGIGLAATVLIGLATGLPLPWDELDVNGPGMPPDLRGYQPLFQGVQGDRIYTVVVHGTETPASTIVRYLLIHTIVAGVTLTVLLLTAWRRTPRSPRACRANHGARRSGHGRRSPHRPDIETDTPG